MPPSASFEIRGALAIWRLFYSYSEAGHLIAWCRDKNLQGWIDMKALNNLISEVNKLEQQLADHIANLATQLEPLPNDRDTSALEYAWGKAMSSRHKLERCLKHSLRKVNAIKETEEVNWLRLKVARRDLKAVKSRLRIWSRCRMIVSEQMFFDPCELASTKDPQVMNHVMKLFFGAVHKIANPTADKQGADAKSHGCHPDIPYPMDWFSNMIGAAHRICLALQKQRPIRFLDVGCGGGTKVLAASTCFDVCTGLEYDKNTVATGRQLLEFLGIEQCKLIHGDAFEFTDYGEYDVIFFYKPVMGIDRMAALEDRVFSQAKPGTVILAAGGLNTHDLNSKGVRELVNNIFITGMSEDEASDIGNTAELMGLMIPGFRPSSFSELGYWKPLLEVSAQNGYYL